MKTNSKYFNKTVLNFFLSPVLSSYTILVQNQAGKTNINITAVQQPANPKTYFISGIVKTRITHNACWTTVIAICLAHENGFEPKNIKVVAFLVGKLMSGKVRITPQMTKLLTNSVILLSKS